MLPRSGIYVPFSALVRGNGGTADSKRSPRIERIWFVSNKTTQVFPLPLHSLLHALLTMQLVFLPCLDVRRRRPAAATEHVDEPLLREEEVVASHVRGSVVVATHGVRQPRVGVHVHEALGHLGETLQEGPHLRGPEGAIEAKAERLAVPHRHVEALRKGGGREGGVCSIP